MNRNRLQSLLSRGFIGFAARGWAMILMAIFSIPALFATHLPEYVTDQTKIRDGRVVRDFCHRTDLKTPFDFKLNPDAIVTRANSPMHKDPAANNGENNSGEEANGYNVKVKLRFSEDIRLFYNPSIYIFNEEYADVFSPMESQLDEDLSWTFNVPEGVYDIFVSYESEYYDKPMRTLCISHSDVEVKGDMEETIYSTEATHLLALEKYLPDGERVVLPKVTYLDEYPWYEVDYSEATADVYTGFQNLHNPVIGNLFCSVIIASEYIENSDERYGIWVSDMSENYTYTETIVIEELNNSVCAVSENTYLTPAVLNDENYRFSYINSPLKITI